MHFTSVTVSAFLLSLSSTSAFSRQAFVPSHSVVSSSSANVVKVTQARHSTGCLCPSCLGTTQLFSTEAAEEVPAEVEALDGIASAEEAHNAERPSRGSLKKKTPPKGKPLDEFEEGQTVQGKVKTITSYGAFVDIGADSDGLLHISQLSKGFVSDVKEFLEIGQEVEVRIVNIDKGKNQVGLSLLTGAEALEEEARKRQPRQQRGGGGGGGGAADKRRDDSAAVQSLASKGWDPNQFVEGTVVSTVDFGAFVRIDVSALNPDATGEMDGLVHISALSAGRANSVTSVVNVNDKVQVRVKSIAGKKVSLSMISPEDEATKGPSGGGGSSEGAADWKESLEKLQKDLPTFSNRPLVVDLRK